MTRAEQVHQQIDALVAEGMTKAQAFAKLSETSGVGVSTLRGAYYSHQKKRNGGSRPRRRETTPEDALADARKALERAMEAIDREVATAATRVEEAEAELQSLKGSAAAKKQEIAKRLEALQ